MRRGTTAALLALLAALAGPSGTLAQQEPHASPGYCGSPARRSAARAAVATVFVGGNLALYEYFRRAWWSGDEAPDGFWIHYDWDQDFRDQDKLGHWIGGYQLSRVSAALLRSACVRDSKAVLWGAVYATVFQLQIEVWDGRQQDYGFSPPDLLFNAAGAGYFVAQARVGSLRHVTPTFSYRRTAALKRALPNSDLRPTVDYSGQTYWMSIDVDSLLPPRARRYWPGIIRVSAGHSITDWVDPARQVNQRAHRRFVVSLDLDPSKLPGDHPVWRVAKRQLSYYRFPAPALQLTPALKGVAWYR